jgi:hypothetical protein
MTPEELLKVLKDGGLDDESIKKLLSDTLASLKGPAEEEKHEEETDEQKASKLLGVNL